MLTLIIFLVVLSLLVFVHELGHFFTARKFGIKAEEFGFGFPPRAWGIYKNVDGKWKQIFGNRKIDDCPTTVYSINWFPLGGFVKIKGEDGENIEPDSFGAKKIWQRAVVLSAGVSMNILLAVVLISISLMIGTPQSLDSVDKGAKIGVQQIQIVQVLDKTPAQKAGLVEGDIVLSINDNKFSDIQSIINFVDKNKDKPLTYLIKRGAKTINFSIKPELQKETGKAGIGVALDENYLVRYPWYQAIWEGIKRTVLLTWVIILAFFGLIKNLVTGHGLGGAAVAGPIGIAKMTGQVARIGFAYLLNFTALLSINLAVINFLPIPALDGGRVFFLIIEKIKGRPMKQELEAVLNNIFFILLIILMLVVTGREVLGLFK